MLGTPVLEGKYIATMDFYPLEAPEFNRISKFYENLAQNKFTTAKCKKCGAAPFPPGLFVLNVTPKTWNG